MAFDARQTIFGALTKARPGLVVRVWDTAEMRAQAKMFVEVHGGHVDLEQVFASKLSVTLQPEATLPGTWKGWLVFNDPSRLAELPIMRAVRQVRAASSRAVVQYQSGGGTIRLDLATPPTDPFGLLADLRTELKKNRITASLRLDDVKEPIESWNPPPLILP